MKTKTLYICEVCEAESVSRAKIRKCEARGVPPERLKLKVGDIVTIGAGYGWYDGDKRWVRNPDVAATRKKRKSKACEREMCNYDSVCAVTGGGNCFGICCTMGFYYVVTFIDRDDCHRARYHVFTKAMTGKNGHRSGYTFGYDHKTPAKVAKPPAFLIEDSKDLIGQKANGLI